MGTDEGDEGNQSLRSIPDWVASQWMKDAIARSQTVPLMYFDVLNQDGSKCVAVKPVDRVLIAGDGIEHALYDWGVEALADPPGASKLSFDIPPEDQASLDRIGAMIRAQQARNDHARLEAQAATRQRLNAVRDAADQAIMANEIAQEKAAPLMRALGAPSMMDVGLPTRK